MLFSGRDWVVWSQVVIVGEEIIEGFIVWIQYGLSRVKILGCI